MKKISVIIIFLAAFLSACANSDPKGGENDSVSSAPTITITTTPTPTPTLIPTPIPTPTPIPVLELSPIIKKNAYTKKLDLVKTEDGTGTITYTGEDLEIVKDINCNLYRIYVKSDQYSIFGLKVGMTKKALEKFIKKNLPDYLDAGTSGSDIDYWKYENDGFTFTIVKNKIFKIQYFKPIDPNIGLEGEGDSDFNYEEDNSDNETPSTDSSPTESDIYFAAAQFIDSAIADSFKLQKYIGYNYQIIGKKDAKQGLFGATTCYASLGVKFENVFQEYTITIRMSYSDYSHKFEYQNCDVSNGYNDY